MLDASALIAAAKGEPGGAQVAEALDRSVIAVANLAEVLEKVSRTQWEPLLAAWEAGGLVVMESTVEDACSAAALRLTRPKAGLSLGDRFCLALAMRLEVAAWTTDGVWSEADKVGSEIAELAHEIR